MTAKIQQQGPMTWLRAGDRPCHWMTAGLVAYKLCDRGFDCATCPLEAAMRGMYPEVAPSDEQAQTAHAVDWRFPDDRLYHVKHTWVQQREPGLWRCGVDAFVAALFPGLARVVLPAEGATVAKGQAVLWLGARDAYLAALFAPLSGRVSQRNPRLSQDPALCIHAPYDAGWLFELRSDVVPDAQAMGLIDAASMDSLAKSQRVTLRDRVHDHIEAQHPELGQIAADGGELDADLKDILDPLEYQELLKLFLN